jgi:hypothetical protein
LLEYQQKISSLGGQISSLETHEATQKSMPYLFVGNTGAPLSYMVKFVWMLYPDV